MPMPRWFIARSPNKAALALALGLAVVLVLLALGCGPDENAAVVDLDRREPVGGAEQTEAITYAYLPQYSHTISYERHRKLLQYLRETTGLPLRQIFPGSFDEHIRMVGRGEIDISFTNPFVYIQLSDMGSSAFARIVEPNGSPDFRGQVITRVDNPIIQTLEDCRGKRWLAVDPASAGGYLFPLGLFMDNGISRDDFAEVAFAPGPGGKQEKVVLGVYAGAADLGTIREGTLDVVADAVDLSRIRILAETPSYPGWVYSSRRGLDPEITETLARAMFALDFEREPDREILSTAGMRGIIPADDKVYDPVRRLAARLGMRPEAIRDE